MSERPIAVITGGASGIGRELVTLYRRDHFVVALDLNQSSLKDLEKEFEGISTIQCDVSKIEDLKRAGEKIIQEFGRPTVWFNNAGIAIIERFSEFPIEEFEKVLAVNISGVVYGTRVAMELMKGKGTIVNMASVNGFVPAPYMTAYSASKHAVVGFTRCLQEELDFENKGPFVVLVAPGFVETPIVHAGDKFIQNPLFEKFKSRPDEVAHEIKAGIDAGKKEIFPTLNGKLMMQLNRLSPDLLTKGGRFLLKKSWKDIFK